MKNAIPFLLGMVVTFAPAVSLAAAIVKASYSQAGNPIALMVYTGPGGGPGSDPASYWALLGKAPEAAYEVKITPDEADGKTATLKGDIKVSLEIRNQFSMGTVKTEILTLVRDNGASRKWYVPAKELKRIQALIVSPMSSHSGPPAAEQEDLIRGVRNILLQGVHIGDPSKAEQLRTYAENSGHAIKDIEKVLIDCLSPGLKDVALAENRQSYLLCTSAISVLGDLGSTAALPSLKKICEVTTDDNMRHAALMAVVQTDREGLLPFAREVFRNRKHYCSHCRFLLYEQLSPYVGVDAVRPVSLQDEALPSGHQTFGPLVLQFMRDAAFQDITTGGNTRRLDQILCIADDEYKKSYEREDALQRLEQEWSRLPAGQGSSSARAYATEQLKALRKTPPDDRTHVTITEIAAAETADQDDQTLSDQKQFFAIAEAFLADHELTWGKPVESKAHELNGRVVQYTLYYETPAGELALRGRRGLIVTDDGKVRRILRR